MRNQRIVEYPKYDHTKESNKDKKKDVDNTDSAMSFPYPDSFFLRN